ncbi:MAG: hypothetical protein NTY35_06615 [Planctomycetota bacterium]|nr:hypothetical protein [Planctomycetota bacterium]
MTLLPVFALVSALLSAPSPSVAPTRLAPEPRVAEDVEFEKRKTEAGDDTAKLWKLYEWCRDSKREKEGKTILKKIVKLEPTHKEANIALGNVFFDGKWFASQKKVDEYKKEKEVAEKTAQGLVAWKDQWVPAEDVPFLDRGLVRDANGNWVDLEQAKKLAEGWVRQDLDWIPPAEKENVGKNLWKCGDQWLPIAEADAYHAELGQWWRIPFERFHLYTTCERDVANQKVKRELENAYDELARAYGTKPQAPLVVIVLRDGAQYSSFANGDEGERRATTDSLGLSSVHHAYFADQNFEPTEDNRVLGVGVGYWDVSSDKGNKWGVHSVRHALGLSFAEALDPSPKTIEKGRKSPMKGDAFWDSFYAEKRIPNWFRYGAAAYAERYYRDNTVGVGGDPLWARKWSVANIQSRGGLRQVKQILDFNLTVEGGPDSEKLINEAGLVVAYLLDGGNAGATEKLKKLQEALTTNKDKKVLGEAQKALEAEILKNEAEIKKFAGL